MEGGESEVASARAGERAEGGRSDRAERAAVREASGRSDAGEEKAAREGAMRGRRYPGRSWSIYSTPWGLPRGCERENPVHPGPGAG